MAVSFRSFLRVLRHAFSPRRWGKERRRTDDRRTFRHRPMVEALESRLAPAIADLAVVKTGPASVTAGTDILYTITVTNNGPDDAQNVTVTDAVPPNTTFAQFDSISQGSALFVGATNLVTISFGTIAAGGSANLVFEVTVIATTANGTVINNTATAVSSTADSDPTNNADTTATTVTNQADLAVTKTDAPDPVNAGDSLTYTVTVTNNGPNDAPGVNVTDTLPAGTTFVSATPSQGTATEAGGTVT